MNRKDTSQGSELPTSRVELEAEILRTRAELVASIDELTRRVNPAHQAQRLAHNAKKTASHTGNSVTARFNNAQKNPAPEPRAKNTKILTYATFGLLALGAATITVAILRRARG